MSIWKSVKAFLGLSLDATQNDPLDSPRLRMANNSSADIDFDSSTRANARERCRYESWNNGTVRGAQLTLGYDIIGAGPRLQIQHPTLTAERLAQIERDFLTWSKEIALAEKLRIARMAIVDSGEIFLQLITNQKLKSSVKLDILLIEADQVSDPTASPMDAQNIDGVILDDNNNPVEYNVLKSHPGSFGASYDATRISSDHIIHYFRPLRPGQHRGIPELAVTLKIFSASRAYLKSTLQAAKNAADISLYIKTPGGAPTQKRPTPFEELQIPRSAMVVLPDGSDIHQVSPENPTSTFEAFAKFCGREGIRPLVVPYAIAAGDYTDVNFSSGQLASIVYHSMVKVDQQEISSKILDRIFSKWIEEYSSRNLILGACAPRWFWKEPDPVDPIKAAKRDRTLREAGLLTDSEYWGRRGMDYRDAYLQLKREQDERARLDLKAFDPTATVMDQSGGVE